TILIAHYLNFDVPRVFYVLFQVDAVIAKRSTRFLAGGVPRWLKLFILPYDSHTAPTAAGRGFENDRIANFIGDLNSLINIFYQSLRTWDCGHPRIFHRFLGRGFVSHLFDLFGSGTDKLNAVLFAYR